MTPIVKWAGGKTKLLPEIVSRLPKAFGRYYEPFAGGAAVFFHLQSTHPSMQHGKAVLGDMNADLINLYEAVRNQTDELIGLLKLYQQGHALHGESEYYGTRTLFNTPSAMTKLQRAAAFIYLNKTCFNGLWRVNKKGEFNVPMGRYEDPPILDANKLKYAAYYLKNAELRTGSYIDTLVDVQAGDLVYLDPPYDDTFNGYTSEGAFDQRTLALAVEALVRGGVHVVMCNSDTPLIRELYVNYRIDQVKCGRAINADGKGRGQVNEVIVVAGPGMRG